MKIAEQAVPNEVDLAPIMAEEFIKGGKSREQLFRESKSGVPGAFGTGEIVAVFPWILLSIVKAAQFLYELLTSDKSTNFLQTVTGVLDLNDRMKQKQKLKSLPPEPYRPLLKVMITISQELQLSGLTEDECDLITYRVVRALLEDSASATLFIKRLE